MSRSLFLLLATVHLASAQPGQEPGTPPPARFKPPWATQELELAGHLPPGMWTLREREDGFELAANDTGARVDVKRDTCALFYAKPPPGTPRVVPMLFPATARVLVEDGPPWTARSCIPYLGVETTITISLPAAPDAFTSRALGMAMMPHALATDPGIHPLIGLAIAKGALGMVSEAWLERGQFSTIAQAEFLYAYGDEGTVQMLRIAAGLGTAIGEGALRAGAHVGLGIEVAPLLRARGEDHTGGSVFVDMRARKTQERWFLQLGARGAYHFDLDCTDSSDDIEIDKEIAGCGPSNSKDFTPRLGWETDLRAGFGPRLQGLFVGARYFGVKATDRVEHGGLLAVGWML